MSSRPQRMATCGLMGPVILSMGRSGARDMAGHLDAPGRAAVETQGVTPRLPPA